VEPQAPRESSASVYCNKLQECVQIAHDQIVECRRLLQLQETNSDPIKTCEPAKQKQIDYLNKLTQKGNQLKQCLAQKTDGGEIITKKGNTKGQCRNPNSIRLRPFKSFDGTEEQTTPSDTQQRRKTNRRKDKQGGNKLKLCLNQIAATKNQCKPLTKCCPFAKTCYTEFKSSQLNAELKQLQKELSDAKKRCSITNGNGQQQNKRTKVNKQISQQQEEDEE